MSHILDLFYGRNFIMQKLNKLTQAVTTLACILNIGREAF
jgi:hypothetical protein